MAKLLFRAAASTVLIALTALLFWVPLGASSGNPHYDSVVGAGQFELLGSGPCHSHFALSARVNDDTPATAPQPTVNGTFNISIEPEPACGARGHLDSKVDCLQVTGNTAAFTAVVTRADGLYESIAPVGSEISGFAVDAGPGGSGDEITATVTSAPCVVSSTSTAPIDRGNISVNDA